MHCRVIFMRNVSSLSVTWNSCCILVESLIGCCEDNRREDELIVITAGSSTEVMNTSRVAVDTVGLELCGSTIREIEMREDPKKLVGGMYLTEPRAEFIAVTESVRRCRVLPVLNISMLLPLLL